VIANAPLWSVQAKRSKQLMDVAKELAEKVRNRVEHRMVPSIDFYPVWATAPTGSKGPTYLRSLIALGAKHVLFEYFDGTIASDADEFSRLGRPYLDRVIDAWQHDQKKISILHMGTLSEEYLENLMFYWSDDDATDNLFRFLRAAQHLGIENDWPELLPARPEMQPQKPKPPRILPKSSPSNLRPYSPPKQQPFIAGNTGRMQNELLRVMGSGEGWEQGGTRVLPGGGIVNNLGFPGGSY
jgi:hypothetical protein